MVLRSEAGLVPRTAALRGRVRRVLFGFAVAAVGAGIAEYLVAASARAWLANGAWLLSSLVATTGVGIAVRGSGEQDRAGWALLLLGCVGWTVGELFWIAYALTGYPASPNAADLCWLGFAAFAGLGVLRLGACARGRRVSWLELAPLIAAVCALVAAVLWNDITSSALTVTALVTALAYPVLYVSAALVMLQSVVTGTLDLRGNRGLALVLAGLALNAVAFVLWTPLLLAANYSLGSNAVDVLWTLGMLLVGLGAATAGSPAAVPDVEQVSHRRGALLPSITFGILALVQAIALVDDAPAGAELALCFGLTTTGASLAMRASLLRREQAALYAQLQAREHELHLANERLSEESRRDPLTGLANRLSLDEDLAVLSSQAERHGRSYCLVLCDLDRFKDYNDALGHQAGDTALRKVAIQLEAGTRGADRAYRYGGEELLLVLPDQDVLTGVAAAERHRERLQCAAMAHPRNPPAGVITFSAGVAAAQPGETISQVLRRADAALYQAKSAGRNQVATAEHEPLPHMMATTR